MDVIFLFGISLLMTLDVSGVMACVFLWDDNDYGMFAFTLFWVIVLFNFIVYSIFYYFRGVVL